jgi:GDP-L-fucose synthase
LYGPNDSYDLQNSHVLPALIRKFHTAKVTGAPAVTLWGSGSPRREFLHVDDLANACFQLMQTYNKKQFLNIGTGEDLTIKELAELIKNIVGYSGKINWDTSRPDGTPRKLMNVSKVHALGWMHEIKLEDGIKKTYANFLTLKLDE